MPKDEFRREVEKELTGKETEPWEIIYFKLYKSQIPVIEQAIDTAALMLGSDKSRSYCLEMICADFLAGANLDNGSPDILLHSMARFFKFLPGEQKHAFLSQISQRASWIRSDANIPVCGFLQDLTSSSVEKSCKGMDGDVKPVAALRIFKFITKNSAANQGTIPRVTWSLCVRPVMDVCTAENEDSGARKTWLATRPIAASNVWPEWRDALVVALAAEG
jgi:hypothetical protein